MWRSSSTWTFLEMTRNFHYFSEQTLYFRGPLPLRGPLPNLLPQAVRCKGPLDHLQTAHEGAKMPLTYKCLFVKKTKMIISLIGFMGCGKSSVGRRLSQLLCCPFIDLDAAIEEREGRTISEIFAAEGEAGFREIELESLLTVVEGGCSKTESLPRLRRGPLPFTRPRAATVFESSTLHNAQTEQHCHPERSEGSSHLILALGGGTVMTPQCAELVMEKTLCIYLKASVDTLMERLAPDNESRPLLCPYASPSMQGEETSPVEDLQLRNRIEHLLSQRSAIYENTANIIIDTDGKSIDQICSEILGLNH